MSTEISKAKMAILRLLLKNILRDLMPELRWNISLQKKYAHTRTYVSTVIARYL